MEKQAAPCTSTTQSLQNGSASLRVDLYGGAIADFHLLENKINPLSFKFSREQMPENNRAGAPYQGHFLCLGRWGEPSAGEKAAGMPNHGQFANLLWQLTERSENVLNMQATAPLEGLQLNRRLQLDAESAIFAVEEQVINLNPLGRVYNMVQHPSLSSPFLDNSTRICCNGAQGFNQHFYHQPKKYAREWPMGYTAKGESLNLAIHTKAYNAVFTFLVEKTSPLGWVTAYSPTYNTLFGYVWKRTEYPWIHLWQHWEGEQIRYRGLEFGTAGVHQPFAEILYTAPRVFGEPTFAYLDAGASTTRRYVAFLLEVAEGYAGVKNIEVEADKLRIRGQQPEQEAILKTSLIDFL